MLNLRRDIVEDFAEHQRPIVLKLRGIHARREARAKVKRREYKKGYAAIDRLRRWTWRFEAPALAFACECGERFAQERSVHAHKAQTGCP